MVDGSGQDDALFRWTRCRLVSAPRWTTIGVSPAASRLSDSLSAAALLIDSSFSRCSPFSCFYVERRDSSRCRSCVANDCLVRLCDDITNSGD